MTLKIVLLDISVVISIHMYNEEEVTCTAYNCKIIHHYMYVNINSLL